MKKYLIFALLTLMVLIWPGLSQATTLADLQAQLSIAQQLLAGVVLSGPTPEACIGDLTIDSYFGEEDHNLTNGRITGLELMLEKGGYLQLPAGAKYGFFGNFTRDAVRRYQFSWGITTEVINGIPYVGPITRSYLNRQFGCGSILQLNGFSVSVATTSAMSDGGYYNSATGTDTGKYKITFDVKANSNRNIYLDGDVFWNQVFNPRSSYYDGATWAQTPESSASSTTASSSVTVLAALWPQSWTSSDISTPTHRSFLIGAGQTRKFIFAVDQKAIKSLQFGVQLTGLRWDFDATDQHANLYTALSGFRTPTIYLRGR